MNNQLFKSIILATIVGMFATGCYTQLKSVEEDQISNNDSAGSTIVNYQPVYAYYPGTFYYDLYNPFYRYGIGYGYGLGFGYGINNFNYIVTVPSDSERKKQIRSSGLYASGEQPNRRTRGDASKEFERNRSNEQTNINSRQQDRSSDTHSSERVQSREGNERATSSRNESTAISKSSFDNSTGVGSIQRRSIPTETRPHRMLAYTRVNIEKRVQAGPVMDNRKWDRNFSIDHTNSSSMTRWDVSLRNVGHPNRGVSARNSDISRSRSVSGTSVQRSTVTSSNNVRQRSTSNSSNQKRSSGSSSKNNRNR